MQGGWEAPAAVQTCTCTAQPAARCSQPAPQSPIHPLQEVVAGWHTYSDLQQQDMFAALRLPAASGDWDQLEGRLQVALDLASLF